VSISQRVSRLTVAVALLATILVVPTAIAYEAQVAGQVVVTGPAATVKCNEKPLVTATVLESGTGQPIADHTVFWELVETQHAGDSLSDTETMTNASGMTTVMVTFGPAPGQRTVRATADDAHGDLVIRCAGGLPDTAAVAEQPWVMSNLGMILAVGAVLLGLGFLGLQVRRG
jgi:hypothetical protein